jgi:GDP-4-dehydro-6-deoxy-D-mannose reductase
MRILVTGAGGFVGTKLVARLRSELGADGRVIGWDHDAAAVQRASATQSRCLDITDAAAVDAAIRADPPSLVFHLAALSSVRQAEGAARRTHEVNVGGTAALAAALAAHAPGAALVFASSADIYGGAFASGEALTETAPVRPLSAYARSKLAAEILLQDVLSATCPVIALRLLNHSGPGQDERFVVPNFAAQIARIEKGMAAPVLTVGNLDAERDFLDVEDVLDAYMAALALSRSAQGFQVYNVASGRTRSIRSILDRLIALATVTPSVEQAAERMRPADIARTACDAAAFRARTGWQPKRDFDDTLSAILDWWRGRVR